MAKIKPDPSSNKQKQANENTTDPKPGIDRKILTANEIKKKLIANRWLIDEATPYIKKMYNLLDEKNIMLFLTDSEGCIIHIESSAVTLSALTSKYIIPGSFPPANTSLYLSVEKAIEVPKEHTAQGTESLLNDNPQGWECWATPLTINPSDTVAIIAIYFSKSLSSKPLYALFNQTANCIRQELNYYEERVQAAKLKEQQLNMFNRYAQADLIVDKQGTIELASNEACSLLEVSKSDLEKKSISKFIPTWGAISFEDDKWVEIESKEITVINVPNSGFYLLSSKAVKRTQNKFDKQIYTLRSMRQVLNEANKYIGNTAYVQFDDIIGISVPYKRMLREAKNIAKTSSPVMILGEKYSGRETVAQAIHNSSSRADYGFVRVDAGTLTPEQLDETLWGYNENYKPHQKRLPKPGAFEFANGGTLYINDIDRISQSTQDKIFEVLQTQKVSRLGYNQDTSVDVRIICSSSADFSKLVETKKFRIDLFYALSTASLRIPPLRERRADIPPLMDHYMAIKSRELNLKPVEIPKHIILILKRYEWPENFKEMFELCERILKDKGNMFKTFKNERDFKKRNLYLEQLKEVESIIPVEDHERELIIRAYNAFNGSISKASRRLGISRNTLYLKLKKYNIEI